MKFFIDSADLGEIKKALDLGLCDGVTTNPSLVAKTGRKFDDVLKEIVALKPGPISAEVTAVDAAGMLREADHYAKFGEDVVVKIPLIVEGLKAVKSLTKAGVKTNVTLCFSPVQALLAAKAGATYISPFVGRLDDVSEDGMAAGRADRRDLLELRVQDAGAGRLGAPPHPRAAVGPHRRRRGDHPLQGDRAAGRSTR